MLDVRQPSDMRGFHAFAAFRLGTHLMKANITPHPLTLSLFGPNGGLLYPHHFPRLVHQLELGIRNYQFPTFSSYPAACDELT
jgi:hypothetical protein